jgi:hypothetical protein
MSGETPQTPEEGDEVTLREQEPPSAARDLGISGLFVVLAIGFLVASEQFAGNRISEYDPGAAFWPRAILAVIVVAGLLNMGLIYRRMKRNDESIDLSTPEIGGLQGVDEKQRQFVLAIGLAIVFFLSLEHIGFLVASPFFLFAFAYIIGYDDVGKLAVFSLAVALIVFFSFRNVMNIALPYGNGIFREISVYAANLF